MNANLLVRKSAFLIKINHTHAQFSAVLFIFFMMFAYHAHSQSGTQVTLKINNPDFVCSPQTTDLTVAAVTAGSDAGLVFSYWLDQATTAPLLTPKAVVGGTYYIKGQRTTPFGVAVLPVIVEVDPVPTTTIIQPTCALATGTITVTAPTGTGMTYSIDGLIYTNTTGVFTFVNAGTYSVTAKSLAGCITPAKSVTIVAAIPSAPIASVVQPTCLVPTGTITITVPTEVGMTYSIDGTTYTNSTGVFNFVSSGTYNLTAKNLTGCISPITKITINAQPATPPAPTTNTIQPTCSLATGTITVTAPTGIGMTYSIDGLTYINTTGIFASIVAGNYNVTAKSSVGCISANSSVTINTQPATPPAPTTTVIQPSCSVVTGTITITAPTGVGMTYSIDGLTYINTTGIFTFVNEGTYSVTAKSLAGCVSPPTSVTILPADPITPSAIVTQPTCSVPTGTITVSAPKEIGMTYSIDNGVTYTNSTGIFALVSPGNYNLTAKNKAGCISPITKITINAQPLTPLAPTTTLIQPSCSVATGTITVTAPTGVGMTYSIDGLTYTNTTGIFTPVITGNYSVTTKSLAGCISVSSSATINAQPATPAAPTASATLQPTCAVATGMITVTAPIGIGMTYSIDGLTYANTTGLFTLVNAGTYNVTAKNASGCISAGTSVTINAQPATPPVPSASVTQPTCAVSTGTITITAPTGIGMTYSIDGLTYTNTTGIFTLVSAGTYNVTAKNAFGCISAGNSLTIVAATPIAPIVNTIQPTCSIATGTITITAPTGIGMTYSIDDGVTYTNSTGIFALVSEGNYNVTAKSLAGCISPITRTTINAQPVTPSAPTASATLQPTCAVATGTITVTAPIGAGITYSIDGVTYTNTTGIFSTLIAGNYKITAKNSAGCISASSSVTIAAQPATPPAPTVSASLQPTCTVATGTITVTAPTGAGMTYSIDGITYSNTTGIFTLVSTGSYNVTVKSADGCISSGSSVTILAAIPAKPIISVTQPNCTVATGTITITAPKENGMTYSIDGLAYSNTNGIFTSVGPGTYNVTAKNTGGCVSTSTIVTIDAQPAIPPAPTASATLQPTCAVSTGTITVTAPTGTGITYSIDGSTYTNSTGIFNMVSAGSYNITSKNSTGCISAGTSVTINAQPATPLAPTANASQPTCSVATGTITVTAPIGAGMTYSIDGTTYTNTTGIFTLVRAGNYNVTARSSAGCTSSVTSLTILESSPPPPTASATLQPSCSVATGIITITAPKETGMTYSINGTTYTNTTGIFTSVGSGIYFVTAKNAGGCISSSTSLTINAQPVTPLTPTASAIQPTCTVSTGTITVTEPTDVGMTYSADGLTYTNTTGVFADVNAGTYTVTAKNAFGCISAGTSVIINTVPDVIVPNVFTPNADGIHDLFEVNCLNPANYPNAEMQVFNRNGNLIYKNDHYGNPDLWNGRSDNKWNVINNELPVGTYYYVLKLGNGKVLTGFVFLAK